MNNLLIKEDLIKDMFNEHISRTRYTDDKKGNYVFDNQIETAKEIIYNFYTKQHRWCLLFAEMQSGKSGTFFSVPYIIARNEILTKKLGIDQFNDDINVFLLTGMNERELIEQFEGDIAGYTGMNIKKNVLHNSEMNNRFIKKDETEWSNEDKLLISRIRKNSLILIDESHYGSDKKQILNKFLTKIIGLNPNGDNDPLIKNNIYVVSISATPMAEFIEATSSDFKKKIVPLKNSKGYYGIVDMFNNNKIHKSFDLKDVNSIDRMIDSFLNIKKDGYILIRSSKYQDEIKNRIGERFIDIDIIYYDSDKGNKNITIEGILEHKPSKKTIIFIKGKLRAGKRINTENIIMIHDTSESKVDTTVQSLLGRCCGYNKNQNIEIYCDDISAEKYKDWIVSGFDVSMVPDKSKNVLSANPNSFTINTHIPPCEYDVSEEILEILYKDRKTKEDKKQIVKLLNISNIIDIMNGDNYAGISLLSPIVENSYKKQYEEPLKGGTFFSDFKEHYKKEGDVKVLDDDYEGKYVISMVFNRGEEKDRGENKISISVGRIERLETNTQTNEKSMWHRTNAI